MSYILTTPSEADVLLLNVFDKSVDCMLEVREEDAFKNDRWLNLGTIRIDPGDAPPKSVAASIRRGAFEWRLPTHDDVRTALAEILNVSHDSSKLNTALDLAASVTVRAGLQHPTFDPQSVEEMPFHRSTTVVADTTSVLQGALDFVARYLHPTARVKIPAIVHMEIVNFADRFLNNRRGKKTHQSDLLIDHLKSQGAQRVLLRLELHAATEIERTFLLGDPLRSAFQPDREPELRDLNLTVAHRAYADRLILESARQHQAQSNQGHPVRLMTSDQGLARMALAEGITPLFFRSVVADDAFGKCFTGIGFDPFHGNLCTCALSTLLWELASAFGNARLRSIDGTRALSVASIGRLLSWSPYQSHADLLWCDATIPSGGPIMSATAVEPTVTMPAIPPSPSPKLPRDVASRVAPRRPESTKGQAAKSLPASSERPILKVSVPPKLNKMGTLQRFRVGSFFYLIDALDNFQSLSIDQVIRIVGLENPDGTREYRSFLRSASLITINGDRWLATSASQQLAVALRNEDIHTIYKILTKSNSFASFAAQLSGLSIGQRFDLQQFKRAATTFRTLGEICCICATIEGEGLYPTSTRPGVRQFAPIAIRRFQALDRGDALVATGAWLESMIREEGIHPEVARQLLDDASAQNLLRRSTEGSTTELRFDNHVIRVLRVRAGVPVVETIHIYRGDYLIPGTSSSSLRIERFLQ